MTLRRTVLTVVCVAGSLVPAWSARAEATGLYWTVSEETVDGESFAVGRLYVCLSQVYDSLLSVWQSDIQLTGGTFNHNDYFTDGLNSTAGSWLPYHFMPGIGNPAIDTFVTIGGDPVMWFDLADNTTSLDPSFTTDADSIGGGWYNWNPPNLQGAGVPMPGLPGYYALMGQFSTSLSGSASKTLSVTFTQTSVAGISVVYPHTELSGVFSFAVPAPGAVALLAACGAVPRRRRRR